MKYVEWFVLESKKKEKIGQGFFFFFFFFLDWRTDAVEFWGLVGGTSGKCIIEDKEKKRIRSKVGSVSQKTKKRKE